MTRLSALIPLAVLIGVPAAGVAQQPAPAGAHDAIMVRASELKWSPLEVAGFAPGATMTVVYGDPSKDGAYTLRLKMPDGYVIPAHFHPNPENLTVLAGTFMLGHGATPDNASLKDHVPGDYLFIPAKSPHFGRVSGETVVQLHGMGPFAITLAQPTEMKK
jgi:quercetin dioxygenase-like cupin family protein